MVFFHGWKAIFAFKLSESMRTIAHIPHSLMRITINHWNEKFQLRYELDRFEQVYKFADSECTLSDVERRGIAMADQVLRIFVEMRQSYQQSASSQETD